MAIREVLRMGDPRLFTTSERITEFGTPYLQQVLQDLRDTMAEQNGAGIAGPQIGEMVQMVIYGGTGKNPRYPDAPEIPFTVLINPIITPLDEAMEDGWEGCLSVPGMRGIVPRHTRIRLQGFDFGGNAIDQTLEGWHARVVQHECDHLFGTLYPMRIKDIRNFGFTAVLFPEMVAGDDD
jgi:peptide deformylase